MEYNKLYRDVYNMHYQRNKALTTLPNTSKTIDGFWRVTTDAVTEIANRYENHPFAMEILTAVFQELERTAAALGKKA